MICPRCSASLKVGHQCLGDTDCKRCGAPRAVRVMSHDARGWYSETQPCAACGRAALCPESLKSD